MLRIRHAQLLALDGASAPEFRARLVDYVAEAYPEHHAELGRDGVERRVDVAIRSAGEHGLTGKAVLVDWLELLVEFGEGLELSPDAAWARELLAHPTLPGRLKLEMIGERLRARTRGLRIVPHRPA